MTVGPQILDMPEKRFGRLTVLREAAPHIYESGHGRRKVRRFECRCDCGSMVTARMRDLRSGDTQSCGCLHDEIVSRGVPKHGDAKAGSFAREYVAWFAMRTRCENANYNSFANYGGRGIKMCARWRHGEDGKTGYTCFLADMGRKPTPKHSLDRINVDGNYEPTNCRWATAVEQRANQRPQKQNRRRAVAA